MYRLQSCFPAVVALLLVSVARAEVASAESDSKAISRTCPSVIESQTDYNLGFDLERVDADDVGACCSRCEAYPACRAFSFNTETRSCYLKGGRWNAIQSDNVVSGHFAISPAPSCTSTVVENYDFYGDDMGEYSAPTADACCALCGGFDGCFAYTYHPQTQRCFLKHGRGAITRADGLVSGYFPTPVHTCKAVIEMHMDYNGDDLGSWPAYSYEACCSLCGDYDLCTHFSYGEHTCWMKYGKGGYEPNNDRVSGYFPQYDYQMVADQFRDYSGSQGTNGWYYLYKLTATDVPMQMAYQTCQGEANSWCWNANKWGQLTRAYMHIGSEQNCGSTQWLQPIRRWVASTAGNYSITITWRVNMYIGSTQNIGFDLNTVNQWNKTVGIDSGTKTFPLSMKTGDYVQYWTQPINGCHGAETYTNMTINLRNELSQGQRFCADSGSENQYLDLHCDTGVINRIVFASYGNSADTCPSITPTIGNCHSETAFQYVYDNCNGRSGCHLLAQNDIFGDPCPGTLKHLMVVAECGPGNGTHNYVTTGMPPFALTVSLPGSGGSGFATTGTAASTDDGNKSNSSMGWVIAIVGFIVVLVIGGLGYMVWRMRRQLKPIRQGFGVLDLDENDDEASYNTGR